MPDIFLLVGPRAFSSETFKEEGGRKMKINTYFPIPQNGNFRIQRGGREKIKDIFKNIKNLGN